MKAALSVVLVCLISGLACGGNSGYVEVRQVSSRLTKSIQGTRPSAKGNVFAVFEIEINNNTWDEIAVGWGRLSLLTADEKVQPASGESPNLAGGCPQDATIPAAGSLICSVAFDVASYLVPVEIRYDPGSAGVSVAFVSISDCTWCGNDCVDLKADRSNCGKCGRAISDAQECVSGTVLCSDRNLTACSQQCVQTATDPHNCGSCGNQIGDESACVGGMEICNDTELTACDRKCVELSTDPDNCGKCGKKLYSNWDCLNGAAYCPEPRTECGDYCVDLKTDPKHCGRCFQECPVGDGCLDALGYLCTGTVQTTDPTKDCDAVCEDYKNETGYNTFNGCIMGAFGQFEFRNKRSGETSVVESTHCTDCSYDLSPGSDWEFLKVTCNFMYRMPVGVN